LYGGLHIAYLICSPLKSEKEGVKMVLLSIKYIMFYKKQSTYVFFSIVAAAMILIAVNVALATDSKISLEQARDVYGDYHYVYNIQSDYVTDITDIAKKYPIEKISVCRIGNSYETSTIGVELVSAEPEWLSMTGAEILEGTYPKDEREIALEKWVLDYFEGKTIGDEIELKGLMNNEKINRKFTISAILKDREYAKDVGTKCGFVSETETKGGKNQIYIKFDESEDVKKVNNQFANEIGSEANYINFYLLEKLDFGFRDLTLSSIFKDDTKNSSGKIQVYFMEWLAGSGIAQMLGNIAVALFAMIIVYSVFRISLQQRLAEYGNLEALGFSVKDIIVLLGVELLFLFAFAMPVGCLLGVLVVKGIYIYYNHLDVLNFPAEYLQVFLKDILFSIVLLFISLLIILLFAIRFLHKVSIINLMKGQLRQRRRNKQCHSWSKWTTYMMPVVLIKYFFEKKGRVAAMILMLSLGGTVFLTSSYVEGEIDRNNILAQRAENGTNADIQVQTETLSLQGIIPEEMVQQISEMPEVLLTEPVSTYFGAMLLDDFQVDETWLENEYWKYLDDGVKRNIQLFGGSMAEEQGKKVLKTEIYGYDKPMLEELENYLIEGSINSVSQENTVILQTVLDGVGNNGLKLHVGDEITLRYPKENHGDFWPNGDHNILRMKPEGKYQDYYEEKTFIIGGVVKDAIAKDEYLMEGAPQIIMPNATFRQIFDVDGFNMVSVQLKSGTQAEQAAKKIRNIVNDIERCGVIDYTEDIIRQSELLEQKMLLVHIVVVLLLVMGLFNILSSVNYILIERRKEFAIIRAMGVTDSKLIRSMVGEGVLYGLIISVLMVVFALIIQYPIKYIFDHGLMFINAKYVFDWKLALGMTGINILFSIIAVILPARMILFTDIKNELKEMG